MNRFYGNVGYALQVETRPGVWVDKIVERDHFGNFTEKTWREQSAVDQVNDNLRLNSNLDIIASPFAIEHFSKIRYICYGGARWVVTSVTDRNPRLHLTLGGIYNGPTPEN